VFHDPRDADPDPEPPGRPHVGQHLVEAGSFNQFLTVRRMLRRAGRLANRVASCEDALEQVGLDPADVLDKWPHQLSGGQRQRVMIARALLLRPRLLVADEPTSMLDASLRVTILNLLTDLRRDTGLAILFVTHDLGQACYVSDRVLVMRSGELVEQGPTRQVIFDPRHDYTRRLLADVPRLARAPGSRLLEGPGWCPSNGYATES
jgi:ABC-type glutathione transport system ATPase component